MFTGIIEEIGRIARVSPQGGGRRLEIEAGVTLGDLEIGGSVAVNGACLTAVDLGSRSLTVEVIQETLRRTNLGRAQVGTRVNLERPLALGGRLEGHWVQGHIDGVARILGRRPEGSRSERFEIELAAGLARYVVEKGSIAVDGISLTVGELSPGAFAVYLIPHTLARTTLGERQPGDRVNLEVDILAKYLERMWAAAPAAVPPGRGAGDTETALDAWLRQSGAGRVSDVDDTTT